MLIMQIFYLLFAFLPPSLSFFLSFFLFFLPSSSQLLFVVIVAVAAVVYTLTLYLLFQSNVATQGSVEK